MDFSCHQFLEGYQLRVSIMLHLLIMLAPGKIHTFSFSGGEESYMVDR